MIYKQISDAIATARRQGDIVKIALLSTVLGDVQNQAKMVDGKKEYSDEVVLQAIKKHLKTTRENLTLTNVSESVTNQWMQDIVVLEEFLPQQMSESEIRDAMTSSGLTNMSELMKFMKANYSGLYDGKVASKVAKEF